MRWNYQLFGFLFVCFFVPQSRRLLCAAFGLFLASGKLCFSWRKIVFLCFGKDFLLYCIFVKLPSSLPVQKAYG